MYKFITNSNISLEEKNMDSVESPVAFDIWSFLHIFSGFFGYIILHKCLRISILKSFILFNILHLLYELKDFYAAYIKVYKNKKLTRKDSFFFHAENSYPNGIVDMICGCIGFLIAYVIFK